MLSVTLGPIALPLAPLLLVAAAWLGSAVASRVGATREPRVPDAGDVLLGAAIAGAVAARLAFVARHLDDYVASPWSAIDLRDGGWHAPAGLGVALAWLALRAARAPSLRRPLAAGVVAAALPWAAASLALGRWDRPPMPGVALAALEGGAPTTLATAAAGRPAVVNLWASWCGPCRQEMPALVAAQARTPGVAVLLVNQGEAPETVRAYLRREGLEPRDVLLDAGSRLGAAVGSSGLPTTLFFDAEGRRVDAHFGVLSEAALAARIRGLAGMR